MSGADRIFVALDLPEADAALAMARRLAGHVGGFKIGLELFCSAGPRIVPRLRETGAAVFVDLKLHDIPNTVAGAAAALGRLGVSFFTMHAGGGTEMLRRGVEAASEAAAAGGMPPPVGLAVTVLTSLDDTALERIGLVGPCRSAVRRLAALARSAGAGGLVCSPLEIGDAREEFPDATLVVPGIRPAGPGVRADDQSRTATPAAAITSGADRLVIGRPIARAADPAEAAARIGREIGEAEAPPAPGIL